LNHLYLYQRDAGILVSGAIFSITIDVVPTPGTAAVLGLGGLLAARRRR
jgi:xanthosine utilization system XapX-like protein